MSRSRSSRRRLSVNQAMLLQAQQGPNKHTTASPKAAGTPLAAAPQPLDIDPALDLALQIMAEARAALLDAKAQLQFIIDTSTDATEQGAASAEQLSVVRELGLLDARRLALTGGSQKLKPPTAGDLAEAQRIAAALAIPIAGSGRVAAIAALAADAVRLTEKLVAVA